MKDVYLLSYDGYDEDYTLMRQGFVTLYDLDNQQAVNKAILEWNKKALDQNARLNFYRELRQYSTEAIEQFREKPEKERLEEANARLFEEHT